jgi:hypothetical protein
MKVHALEERRDFISQNVRDAEEFSHPQADRIAGAMRREKSRPAAFGMTVRGGLRRAAA